jgi:hypothetical protein
MPASTSEQWTPERLKQLITDGVEESLQLEYKRAASLGKQNDKTTEVTKDVSAMANSVGGTIFYGIAEHHDPILEHLPEKLDPIVRKNYTREWLEQIIQTIQPRIEGIKIHAVVDELDQGACYYVVEIPQSHIAHQARDHRYYRRHNFMSVPMEDFEIRDVMNRRKYPRLLPKVRLTVEADGNGHLRIGASVNMKNCGMVSAREAVVHVGVFLEKAFELFSFGLWTQRPGANRGRYTCNITIHPEEEIPFLQNIAMNGYYEGREQIPEFVRYTFKIFATDAPPLQAEAVFDRREITQATLNHASIERDAQFIALP